MSKTLIKTYPNQQTAIINKINNNSPNFQIKKSSIELALKNLSPSGLRLYIYFMTMIPDARFAVSPAAILNATGIARTTYYRALSELEEKKYLHITPDSNQITFFEIPSEPSSCDDLVYDELQLRKELIQDLDNLIIAGLVSRSAPTKTLVFLWLKTINNDSTSIANSLVFNKILTELYEEQIIPYGSFKEKDELDSDNSFSIGKYTF